MNKNIFVNLPVKNLDASIEFFKKLGYSFNPQFTDETATCMIVSDTIFVMLLTHDKFASFAPHAISDANRQTEVLVCLSCESRAEVEKTIEKAVAAGAKTYKEPIDYGFMYGHGFQDIDGHAWEFMWMDMSQMPQNG
jgi:predicted lactoylglutathione lyase